MTIDRFADEYAWAGNFYQRPFLLPVVGEVPDVEHPFQAAKTTNAGDRQYVLSAPTAAIAKKRGREIKCRDDWDQVKRRFMLSFVLAKFVQHDDLAAKLAATNGDMLIEGNYWHDNFWGSCYGAECERIRGQNYLGKILMAVRMVLC